MDAKGKGQSEDYSRLEKLIERRDQLTAQINAAKARQRAKDAKQRRRDDTSRKVIAGALALEHAAKNPQSEFARVLFRLLDEYTDEKRRHLFPFDDMKAALKNRPTRFGLGRLFKDHT